jgi:5'-nucleotidase
VPASDVKGVRVVSQGFRRDTKFGAERQVSPSGRMFMWVTGGPQHIPTAPGTDAAANLDGFVSVTPLRADLTAHDTLDALRARLE